MTWPTAGSGGGAGTGPGSGSGSGGGTGTGGGGAGSGPKGGALTVEQRTDNYRRQTDAKELTPRQRRRVEHKANRAAVRSEMRQS